MRADHYKKIHETSQQKTYKTWKNIHASTHLRTKLVLREIIESVSGLLKVRRKCTLHT